ncbi:LysM peptidoglycan-binding domain-containing protein [Actinospongicola halichondriae]|uniref:LysM peptidoglycan-binding domain-containing protein n=1 Tax=Actinospongicola halichondriae TaxID=3236844 RepID=UPI003D41464B
MFIRVPLRPRDLIAVVALSAFALAASGTHTVRSGETLSDIAAKHGTSVRAIVEANGISNPNLIVAGRSLEIPTAGGGSSSGTTYTVEKGDTLGAIARKFNTSVSALVTANGITNPNVIQAGKKLTISGGGSSGGTPSSSSGSTSSGKQLAGQRHLVQSGDTIAGIARKYGISQADFIRWNGLQDGKIYASTRLLLFDPGTLPGTGSTAAQSHTVKNGENLGSIARRYGTSASAIAKASGLSDVNHIYVGQKLTIPGSSGSAGARCPVPGAKFINGWGFARSGGRSHAGIDLFAPTGTPVYAPASGWVDIATGSIGGHQFRLTDANGTLWFGSHMSKFGKTGQVKAGDVIGYVGDTGNAKGSSPHLHFEVHPQGQAVNPYPFLRAAC